jgi:hypothetical protein
MDLTSPGTSLFWTYKHNKKMPIIINKKYWPLGLTPTFSSQMLAENLALAVKVSKK